MNSINNLWIGTGNLGADPVVKSLPSGTKVAQLSLATNETYKKNGETVTETQWHNLIMWGPQAEFAEKYLQKGSELLVHGRLKYRSWDDKEGNKKYNTEIHVDSFKALRGGKKEQLPETPEASNPSNQEEDLPF